MSYTTSKQFQVAMNEFLSTHTFYSDDKCITKKGLKENKQVEVFQIVMQF
jgi:hypothetical protein